MARGDDQQTDDQQTIAQEILGYLNFSSGTPDASFLRNLNDLFGQIDDGEPQNTPAWQSLGQVLQNTLGRLRGQSDAFREVAQAEAVLRLVFDVALDAYRHHHRDLLQHQTDESLFRPLFIGRLFEAVLQQGGPWDESDRIVAGALRQLNDFLGHRPVAVLETEQKIRPYAHEYVRPIPLYVRDAGVAVGRYRELIERALEILDATDSSLLFQAWFDPEMLDELAMDPRAFDFDHPVSKRPNYLYGQWDPDKLDGSGFCRRFVVQEVALEAMMSRVEDRKDLPREEALFEAAAVLAGTMLMGSGVSGNRPDAHDSDTTLATLVQHIAIYRDAFYGQLLSRLSGRHSERLRAETLTLRQPFGGARQDFNQHLARRRAEQLEHVQLAQVYARMGYTEAAAAEVRVVSVASARMTCDIRCRLTATRAAVGRGELAAAAALIPEIEDMLHRAIECGALVDPWNILGFGAQYSLFPAIENSVPDHRVEELIDLLGEIFGIYVQLQKAAAAAGDAGLRESLSGGLDRLAVWWDKFASTEIGSVDGISGRETCRSADHVADVLRAWHEAGTAAGDVAFWRGHVERFRSAKAYALVVEALLQQRDLVAAMALLIQWLSQSEEIPLIEEGYSFHELAWRWMEDLWRRPAADPATSKDEAPAASADSRWALSRKFLDYLEANAGEYWEVPLFELATDAADNGEEPDEETGDDDGLFGAAYEGVTYRDSTDDGFDGEMIEGVTDASDLALTHEGERVVTRLAMHSSLARLWKLAAVASAADSESPQPDPGAAAKEREAALAGWLAQATANAKRLAALTEAVHRYRIPPPIGSHESLVEFDRHRGVKEMLLEQIIATSVEVADAAELIRGAMLDPHAASGGSPDNTWREPAAGVLRGVLRGDVSAVRDSLEDLIDELREQPLLYVALGRGGNPRRIVQSRSVQRLLRRLLGCLPRLGLVNETLRLIETIQEMELDHPVGAGGITEFDQLFRIGCKEIVRCLVVSSEDWHTGNNARRRSDDQLIELLENATEALLQCWISHSRGVRLSVLESVTDEKRFRTLRRFIEQFGGDLFTQHFMTLGNLNAILHQGTETYLQALAEQPEAEELRLVAELDRGISLQQAAEHLEVILDAVVENYAEYVDYNSTTTQSDRGEMLHTLLDFLRLRANYDRVAWRLLPVVLAHEVMVRCGRDEAAATWREAVVRRTRESAEDHVKRLARLSRRHGMRLSSIADRVGERFVRPLAIDRLCALVRPAIDELNAGEPQEAFGRLQAEIAELTAEPSGTGFEIPAWLDALQQEVELALSQSVEDDESLSPDLRISPVRLSLADARAEVESMEED